MTQEEKAKRYDEALEKAKKYHKFSVSIPEDMAMLESIFPELKENEDERIREALLEMVHDTTGDELWVDYNVHKEEAIAWLEKQGKNNMGISETTKQKLEDNLNKALEKETPESWNKFLDGGEQKPADKVEPKFHEGEWAVSNLDRKARQISEVHFDEYNSYYVVDGKSVNLEEYDRLHHLWTIQDAKDGDVLCCESGWTCIFKTLVNDETFSSYCFMDNTKWFCETGSECHTLKEEFVKVYNGKIYPATKEQRDTLMKAMADAGYTFGFEKKELKKIEQKHDTQHPTEWSVSDFRTWQYIVSDVLTKKDGIGQYLDSGECKKIAKYMQEEWSKKLSVEQRTTELPKGQDYGIDGLYAAIDILIKTLGKVGGYQSDDGILTHKCAIEAVNRLYKQKPAWSEEDERIRHSLIIDLSNAQTDDEKVQNEINEEINWLKSLKDRVLPQPKQEWSEEDENILEYIEEAIINYWLGDTQDILLDWLKSLRPQNTWKPNDEQMEILQYLCETSSHPNEKVIPTLESLYQDLKKLK